MSGEIDCPACEAKIDGPAANLPSVVRELRMVLAEIDAYSRPEEESQIDGLRDDLADKRRTRGQAAASS